MNPDCEHSLKKDTPILYGSWVCFDKKISDSRVLEEKWWPIDTHTHARTQARTHAHTHAYFWQPGNSMALFLLLFFL